MSNVVGEAEIDETERDEELEDLKRELDGTTSTFQRKRLFDDVTFEHKCSAGEILIFFIYGNLREILKNYLFTFTNTLTLKI